MPYPGDRCPGCKRALKELRPKWDNAKENVKNIGLDIAREIRRDQ
jgi:hypothetical protein